MRRLPYHLIYHDAYDLNLGEHVFPARKYRWIRDSLLRDHVASAEDFATPLPASDEDVRLVHEPGWVRRLRTGTLSYHEILRLEIPYSRRTIEGFWLAAGGTILAARLALQEGIGFNVGGGFHHAFPAHGEGFCAIHDIAIAIRRLQADDCIRRAMVVDCDVHHGNGTAAIFAADPSVYTLSIHQFNNYPSEKPLSDMDIHLADGTGDAEYLERLENGLHAACAVSHPELVVYVAGADPYGQDQLGGLNLTFDGLAKRDRLVLGHFIAREVPVAVVLAGGYAANVLDTVWIHVETARVAAEILSTSGWKPGSG
jgi:acetoin utilization deacetylase AcuC-like enzyme